MGNFSYHVRWGKSMTENSLFSKHLTTIIWQIKYGEVKHCTTFFILNQRPLRVILVTTNNLERKPASTGGQAGQGCGRRDQGSCCLLSVAPAPWASSDPTREGEAWPWALPSLWPEASAGCFQPLSPHPHQGPRGALGGLTDVLREDYACEAGGLGQAGLHHCLPGALLLIQAQRLDAGHLRPGR